MIRLQDPWENDGEGTWASMPDGRVWGPFQNPHAAREWETLFERRAGDLVTARDLYEGAVRGDAAYLISERAIEWGVHPFQEIYDFFDRDDNGLVVADHASGAVGLHPRSGILVDSPTWHEPSRRLPLARPGPAATDCRVPELAVPCEKRGEIVVVQDGSDYLVAWRQDSRSSRSLPVLSLHTLRERAFAAARYAARSHDPGPKSKSYHVRDYQRARVYAWESRLERHLNRFGSIEECRSCAAEICEAMNLPLPELRAGRRSLEDHSYYSPATGIVLQAGMMDSLTVLHELAHYAVYVTRAKGREPREASHGPRFTGMLAGMLSAFAGADLDRALASAAEAGVDIDEDIARKTAEAAVRAPAYR